MTELFTIKTASGDGIIFGIVVFFVIVGNLIKMVKKVTEKKSEPTFGETGQGYTAPEDELQDFLQSLVGAQSKKPTPPRPAPPIAAPPPVPAGRQKSRPVSRRQQVSEAPQVATRQKRRMAGKRKRAVISEEPITPVAQSVIRQAVIVDAPQDAYAIDAEKKKHTNSLRTELGLDLIKSRSLRKGILLKEVLDKPLAMRKPA